MVRSSWRRTVAAAAVLVASVSVGGASQGGLVAEAASGPAAPNRSAFTAAVGGPVFTAAGDIDGCNAGADTAKLVAKTSGPVATIGDNAYPGGSTSDYSQCYDPTWGAFKDRTHPIPGNHDYDVSKATPYYQYFGAAAGTPGSGWYSYDVGSWHVVALNSNCDDVNCSKEAGWLDADLTANPAACILAYWHHPRFTSGTSGGNDAVGAFWNVLYAHQATLVLNGHDHDYERFAPQDPSGHADPAHGIREFIVGTGGAALGSLAGVAPNSQVRNNGTYGVIELTLGDGAYDWRFVPVAVSKFTDSGSDTCRGTAPAAAPAPPSPATTAPPAVSAVPPPTPPPAPPEASGPSDAAGPAPAPAATPGPDDPAERPAPTAPPARRNQGPATPPSSPAASGDSAAGSGSARGGPAATSPPSTAVSTAVPSTGPAPAAAVAPAAAPAGDPVGPSADGAGTGPAARGAGARGAAEADDATPLPVAIAGLIHGPAPARSADRRGLAGVAVVLLALDTAGLAAYGRRRRTVFR
jgi:hypothetical protein